MASRTGAGTRQLQLVRSASPPPRQTRSSSSSSSSSCRTKRPDKGEEMAKRQEGAGSARQATKQQDQPTNNNAHDARGSTDTNHSDNEEAVKLNTADDNRRFATGLNEEGKTAASYHNSIAVILQQIKTDDENSKQPSPIWEIFDVIQSALDGLQEIMEANGAVDKPRNTDKSTKRDRSTGNEDDVPEGVQLSKKQRR